MVANKHTKKEVISFCGEISELLSSLKINETDKKNIKKYEKLQKQSEKCKKLINGTKNDKKDNNFKSNYNIYIKDCFLIKNGETSFGILPKNIENELFADIKKNNKNNYLSIFGDFWKNRLDEDIKNNYKNKREKEQEAKNLIKDNVSENIKHRGRPKKNIINK